MSKWEVELWRVVNCEWQVIRRTEVWEYDDECASANVFYRALEEFEPYMEEYDIIKTPLGATQYKLDGTGEASYVIL